MMNCRHRLKVVWSEINQIEVGLGADFELVNQLRQWRRMAESYTLTCVQHFKKLCWCCFPVCLKAISVYLSGFYPFISYLDSLVACFCHPMLFPQPSCRWWYCSKWSATCTDDGQAIPLVPLTEEQEDALESTSFQDLMRHCGLHPPSTEQVSSLCQLTDDKPKQSYRHACPHLQHTSLPSQLGELCFFDFMVNACRCPAMEHTSMCIKFGIDSSSHLFF